MLKLFLKLYFFLILTLIVSSWIQEYAWTQMLRTQGTELRKERGRGTFFLVEQSLQGVPVDDWPARFAKLKPGFVLPASLEKVSELAGKPDFDKATMERLNSGEILLEPWPDGGYALYKRLGDSPYAVHLQYPLPPGWSLSSDLIMWTTFCVMFALVIYVWVRPFWNDLRALMGAADNIGAGRLDTRVKLHRGSPLTPLAAALNAMTERIGTLIESHKGLTNAVSHELRTPLARLRFGHSLAMEDETLQGKDNYLAVMERDIGEMDELTRELLTYAKLEREAPAIDLRAVAAQSWVDELITETEREARDTGSKVSIRSHVRASSLYCEPRYMARAAGNLLRNALRYAKTTVDLTLEQNGDKTYLHVDDDGPGIPAGERARIFEPFTRLDQSRTRSTGGFGLGLSIVQQVARWHRGDAAVGDSPLGGARVTIYW